ncbi:hypothetical protein GQ54DRAFT_260274 [Martensiomyces pterosporus]|nr:hypothetical protein GQ54DRAFT_260274 [Martensiomyces pterosporus]
MLLDRGADPTCTNREGKTALMLVVQRAHAWTHRSSHIFEWLLDVFAQSLIRRDKEGRTLVHWACMRPLDPPSNWPEVSLYYMRLLVLKFNETRHLEVFSWCDYLGFSARHIAIQAQQLPAVVSLLDSTCQNAIYPATIRALRAAAAAGSPQTLDASTSEQQHVPSKPGRPVNRYDVAASQAVDIIRSSTMELRKQHESQLRQVDEDAEYAAQLLLELRTERDNLQLESAKYQELSLECSEAGSLESMLKSKVNSAINMQQSARASIILQHSAASPLTSASSPSLDGSSTANLRSEYLRLKREAEVYQENSLKLATEYSGLAAVVKPWPRPPALSLVGMFGDGGSAEGHISSDVRLHGSGALAHHGRGGVSGSKPRAIREIAVIDSESADVKAISSALEVDEQRLRKFERVVSAACGDLSLDRVRNVVGPVLSVLNNGNTL